MRNFCDQHLVEHFTRNVLLLSLLGNKKKTKKTNTIKRTPVGRNITIVR